SAGTTVTYESRPSEGQLTTTTHSGPETTEAEPQTDTTILPETTAVAITTDSFTDSPGPASRPSTEFLRDCHACRNMAALLMNQSDSYDGMMVLDHSIDSNGCRIVKVDCVPTTADENATLFINGQTAVATGVGSHLVEFTCNRNGRWSMKDGVLVSSVSCLVQQQAIEVTSSPEISTRPTTTTTTTTTPRPPGIPPCMSCPQLSVVPLLTGYRNGFTTLLSGPDDDMALVISGTVFEQGVGSLKTNLTCNDMMTWTTSDGYAVPFVSCGAKIGKSFCECLSKLI
ncbi:hypothetical protein GCK32_016219, partial [Trichostrongylus colubriformis]